ncbi:Tetratricopeptide repeat protein 19 [Schistosoma japonicum]|uniref:SJCHGC04902 protein n=2 Tax=Schistosoma japonicum TaxID=6182 RepID=Q5DE11_SCHJA|nr:SJCHGC04902 protein [Schistosoma japonicum]TNN17709.1 Tetratricopeptide repeat protein 19 [Schistosoma japonicum]
MWKYILRFARFYGHHVHSLLYAQYTSQTQPAFSKTLSFVIPFTWWPFEFWKEKDIHDQIQQLFNDSLFHIAAGEFNTANDKLHELMYFVNQSYQNQKLTDLEYVNKRARICSEMANLNLIMGNHSAAETLLKQTMQDCLTGQISLDDSMFIELSLKMALLFEKSNRLDDAEAGFRFCIESQEKKLANLNENTDYTNEKALLGMCCNYFSKFLFSNQRQTEALVYAQRAYDIASQIYPLDHTNCLNLLIDISAIKADLNRFTESENTLEQVIQISQAKFQSLIDHDNLLISDPSKLYEIHQIISTLIHSLLQLAVVNLMLKKQESVNQLLYQANQIVNQTSELGLKISVYRKQINDFKMEHHLQI